MIHVNEDLILCGRAALPCPAPKPGTGFSSWPARIRLDRGCAVAPDHYRARPACSQACRNSVQSPETRLPPWLAWRQCRADQGNGEVRNRSKEAANLSGRHSASAQRHPAQHRRQSHVRRPRSSRKTSKSCSDRCHAKTCRSGECNARGWPKMVSRSHLIITDTRQIHKGRLIMTSGRPENDTTLTDAACFSRMLCMPTSHFGGGRSTDEMFLTCPCRSRQPHLGLSPPPPWAGLKCGMLAEKAVYRGRCPGRSVQAAKTDAEQEWRPLSVW